MQQQQQQQQQPQPQTQYHHSNSMSLMFVTTSKVTSPLSPHCLCRLGRLCPRRRRLWDRLGTSLGRNLGRCLGRRSCRRRLRLGCRFAVVPVLLASRRRLKVPGFGIRWDKWWLDHLGSIPLQLVHFGPAGLTHPDCWKRGTSFRKVEKSKTWSTPPSGRNSRGGRFCAIPWWRGLGTPNNTEVSSQLDELVDLWWIYLYVYRIHTYIQLGSIGCVSQQV